jgi:hypothetical protein
MRPSPNNTRMAIIPRANLAGNLLGSASPLTILTGDSGIGKTTLLDVAIASGRADCLIPDRIPVGWAPGSLQRALLDSLGTAIALVTSDQSAGERIGETVQRVVHNIAQTELRDLAGAVGRHLLGLVRARVSPEAADALARAGQALASSNADTLSARITNASDTNVVEVIASFAAEVREPTGGRDLILALDNLERLPDDDLRRLGDLIALLPQRVRIWGAFGIWDVSTRNSVEFLCEAGAEELLVGGLTLEEVAAYLNDRGLSPGLAPLVSRTTQGYPLYVQEAVALLQAGTTDAMLAELKPPAILLRRTRQTWRDLIPAAQRAALLLAAFSEPLPSSAIPDYLGMDQAAWAVIEATLHDAMIFTGEGRWWFHEMRRRCIWNSVLSEQEHSTAAQAAQEYLATTMEGIIPNADDLLQYLRLTPFNPLVLAASNVQIVLNATRDQLAVAAAVLDLIEP